MIEAFRLGGNFAAHAVWVLSDDPQFSPTLSFTGIDGETVMERLSHVDLAAAVEMGRLRLNSNATGAAVGALVFDGRITLGNRKYDAIIVEMRTYDSPDSRATTAVPYTPQSPRRSLFAKPARLRVHRPKVIEWSKCEQFEVEAASQAFFDGVDQHKEGAKVWAQALDESV